MKCARQFVGGGHSQIAGIVFFASIVALSTTASADLVSNFNGTNIADTSYIWFNSHLTSVTGGTGIVEIYVRNQRITLTSSQTGIAYSLVVPDATIIINPTIAGASTTFSDGSWTTEVANGKNAFMSGYTWDVPTGENPKAANPVAWWADFYSNQAGVSLSWQWGAAVYTTFSDEYDALNVMPINGRYNGKSYQPGTPLAFANTQICVGGARGGGSSNFTGSWSPTGSATAEVLPPEPPIPPEPVPLPGAVLLGSLGLSCAGWRLRRGVPTAR